MDAEEYPLTPGVRYLRARGIPFVPRCYPFEDRGGTAAAARALQAPEHAIIKTLVVSSDAIRALLVLMHGDRQVSLKTLARALGAKRAEMCEEETARRLTGYLFGGTSPFGTRTPLPVYAERTILELPRIFINGGKRGFLIEMDPADLKKAFDLIWIDVAIP
ncbi:MAG: Cys-tRNA(Pro) deacylase [Acidobacteria bacterium]|nr:Cys-tRNA(Pro) deacylase [Acidobacteriota bacterium]